MLEKLAISSLFGLITLAFIVRKWRTAIFFVMILLVFEGALRKWVLPGSQAALYFVKDFIFLGAYIGFWTADLRRRRSFEEYRIGILCTIFAMYCCVQILNPSSPSILLGALGWKAYCWYMPLAFLVPFLVKNTDDLMGILWRYLMLSLPIALLGIFQFYSPSNSLINANVAHDAGGGLATLFGGGSIRVRATGTFSYISGYAEYLMTIVVLAIIILSYHKWKLRNNVLSYVTIILAFGGIFTTGSRGALFTVIIAFMLYFLLLAYSRTITVRVSFRAIMAFAIVGIITEMLFQNVYAAVLARTQEGGDTMQRMLGPFIAPLHALEAAPLLGFGTGTTHNAAESLLGSDEKWWLGNLALEGESGRVMAELGLPGFIIFYGLRAYIAFIALRYTRSLRMKELRALAAGLFIFFAVHLIGGIVVNPTAAVLFWFGVGLLFTIKRLDSLPQPSEARNAAPQKRQDLSPGRF